MVVTDVVGLNVIGCRADISGTIRCCGGLNVLGCRADILGTIRW